MTESRHNRREGRGRIGLRGRRLRLLREGKAWGAGTAALVGATALPLPAAAAGSFSEMRTQVTVGTLPLLVALGIGILVAAIAVIAFLQMTTKGQPFVGQLRVKEDEETETAAEEESNWQEAADDADDSTAADSEYEEDAITDYTIPVTRILAAAGAAEPAFGTEPRLCGIVGEHAGASYRLLGRKLLIGRDAAQCAVVFPYEAGEVSRRHCTVKYDEETNRFLLEDHGSSNGTFLASGVRLVPGKAYELCDGDRFSLSGAQHIFEVKAGV